MSNLDEDKGFFQLSSPCMTVLKFLNNKFLPCDRPLEPPLPDVSHLDEEEFSKKRWCFHALLRFNCTKSIALQLKNFCPLNKIWQGCVEKLYTKIATIMDIFYQISIYSQNAKDWGKWMQPMLFYLFQAGNLRTFQSPRVCIIKKFPWEFQSLMSFERIWSLKTVEVSESQSLFSLWVFRNLGGQRPMDCSITS